MKFKEFLKESIIDIPRKTYAPGVFDNANTNSPKLKQSVKDQINKQFAEFEKEYPIVQTGLIGSILTKRYRNDADLDVNVLFSIPKDKDPEEERERLSKKYLSSKNPDNVQGQLIPGTKHPINYYFITDKKTYDSQAEKADAVFDWQKDKWIKKPNDFVFDANLYVNEFQRKVQELDVVKGELTRDIIDYNELTELSPGDVENLQKLIDEKLKEIESGMEDIVKIGDGVDADRRAAFDKDMSPDEIRTFGIKNRLPKNVIYKMLEKYHYLTFYKKIKKILDDGVVTDAEVDSLQKENVSIHEIAGKGVAFTFGRFNPPTIGHEKLLDKTRRENRNYVIYPSQSQDSKQNPLDFNEKVSVMKTMFPIHSRSISSNTAIATAIDAMTDLYRKKYTDVTMVVGSDRVGEFQKLLNTYNGKKARHGYYKFNSINVVSAGERDPDAEGVSGMSASKMRKAAQDNDYKSFEEGLPKKFKGGQKLFNLLRKAMGLKGITEWAENAPVKEKKESTEEGLKLPRELEPFKDRLYRREYQAAETMYKQFIKRGDSSGEALHRAASSFRHVSERGLRDFLNR